MNAEQLMKQLANIPGTTRVVISSDEEGNSFHALKEVEQIMDANAIVLWPSHNYLDME